jgi:5-methylcytosine-specific restriction endonuclease McrA
MNREKRRMTLRISQQARRIAGGWSKNSKAVRKAIEETLELARIGNQYLDAYTGELIDEPTIDHIIPISKGGTNDADNLCVTSLSNNSSKFNDSLLIWLIKRRRNV